MQKNDNTISCGQLKKLVDYNCRTGIFTWKFKRSATVNAGDVAGGLTNRGYVYISICGTQYLAHRLAWLYVTGKWPKECIDHKNGQRDDNRFCNLREVTYSGNSQNQRKAQKGNKAGLIGAHYIAPSNKWMSNISADGKNYRLGTFDTPEEAHAAYLKAKAELHPFETLSPKRRSRATP